MISYKTAKAIVENCPNYRIQNPLAPHEHCCGNCKHRINPNQPFLPRYVRHCQCHRGSMAKVTGNSVNRLLGICDNWERNPEMKGE